MVEFCILNFSNESSLTEFEERYDPSKTVRTFLEGVLAGIEMFSFPDKEVSYFDPGVYKVGKFRLHFYYKSEEKGQYWNNVYASIEEDVK